MRSPILARQSNLSLTSIPLVCISLSFGSHWEVAEVEHEKSKEAMLTSSYEAARASGRNFADQAAAEQDAMLKWKLGLLFDPDRFEAWEHRLTVEAAVEMGQGVDAIFLPGSAYNRHAAVYLLRRGIESLLKRHPELREQRDEFYDHLMKGPVPALRLPALLRAGLGMTPGREARASDGYDVLHLTRGLSRCDVVTADSGM